jgi:serine protease Do
MNRPSDCGISIGSLAMALRSVTVRISGSRGAHGSGVIWHSKGLVVTNAHVADGQVHTVELPDGTRVPGWVLARDRELDLAALALSAGTLPAIATRPAHSLRPGELVIAVGYPADGDGAMAAGIVHRSVAHGRWILADIRLAPGNSGGPLADAQGRVIGINSMIVNQLGCAVTSDAVAEFLIRSGVADGHPIPACTMEPSEAV